MKVYVSVDIEGVTGTYHWDETEKCFDEYGIFRDQMTEETAAACRGALAAGAEEIWVKDAHDTGRNIIHARLPREARLLRGWSGHPFQMVEGIDSSFDALVMIGYHSGAGSDRSPLSHTGSRKVRAIIINGEPVSEMVIYGYAAASAGVPLVFISGDRGICDEAMAFCPAVRALPVKEGRGDSVVSLHPDRAVSGIEEGVSRALEGSLSEKSVALPDSFSVEIIYREHTDAYRASFFPGVNRSGTHGVAFQSKDYFEVLRALLFLN